MLLQTNHLTKPSARNIYQSNKIFYIMKKRGLSNVFVVVILFLLAFVAVIIFWNILSPEIKKQGEVGAARQQLITERLDITRVSGVFPSPNTFTIIIQRGATQQFLANVTIERPKGQIVFLVDSTDQTVDPDAIGLSDVEAVIPTFIAQLENEQINVSLGLIEF